MTHEARGCGGESSSGGGGGGGSFTPVTGGASLMLSFRPTGRKVLVLGTRRLAASRLTSILEADAEPVVVGVDCGDSLQGASEEVRWRIEQQQQQQCSYIAAPQHDTHEAWAALIDELDGGAAQHNVFAVCITDTLHAGDEDDDEEDSFGGSTSSARRRLPPVLRAKLIAEVCRARRIPINVADRPKLCDFSFPAAHRFSATALDGKQDDGDAPTASSLQIAVTTNGRGCRLAGRIRREIVASLPRNVGDAVERVGTMREMAKRKQHVSRRAKQSNGGGGGGGGAREPSLRRKAFAAGSDGDATTASTTTTVVEDIEEEDLTFDSTPINSPVPQLSSPSGRESADYMSSKLGHNDAVAAAAAQLRRREEEYVEERKRRMRWVAQMSEYWPIDYLGSLSSADMTRALETYKDEGQQAGGAGGSAVDGEQRRGRNNDRVAGVDGSALDDQPAEEPPRRASSRHNLTIRRDSLTQTGRGRIFLVGSGPGHPGLLTAMAYRLLTSTDTDVVLSDKLVPSSILSLIPKQTPLHIARKFPGNAEGAQSELIALALDAARQGKRVIRLKQGDPFVFGRGGEEVLAFARANVPTTVVPGISSALAAPLMLGIPVTQRGAADSMTLCTGVGRGGKSVRLPGYERNRSLVVLMGVARLRDMVKTLCGGWQSCLSEKRSDAQIATDGTTGARIGAAFPPYTPIAIIERASSTDQRLVASTLDRIEYALTRCGEQRPPGMMLIGWAVMSLDGGGSGNVDVLDDEAACEGDAGELERRDRARVTRWTGAQGYIVREGLDGAYRRELAAVPSDFEPPVAQHAPTTSMRGPSGWAPPRYGEAGVPRGGWGEGEEPAVVAEADKPSLMA